MTKSKNKRQAIAVDIFLGAGGLSLGGNGRGECEICGGSIAKCRNHL